MSHRRAIVPRGRSCQQAQDAEGPSTKVSLTREENMPRYDDSENCGRERIVKTAQPGRERCPTALTSRGPGSGHQAEGVCGGKIDGRKQIRGLMLKIS